MYTISDNQFKELKAWNGTPAFPHLFTDADLTADFELVHGRDAFSWKGVPGELYHVNAPLNSNIWNETFRRHLGHWRCAVFTPEGFERNPRPLPIVFTFAGIGGDYSDSAVYLPKIVQEMGCIMVAFDLHLTGLRVLTDNKDLNKGEEHFGLSIGIMKEAGRPIDNDCMAQFVHEQAFNIMQVCAMLKERYKIPCEDYPPIVTLGFSLGGFYAFQSALQLPGCIGAVCGGASADICGFGGPFDLARNKVVETVAELGKYLPQELKLFAYYIMAISAVDKTPIVGVGAGNCDIPIRFVIGSKDSLVSAGKEAERFAKGGYPNHTAIDVEGIGHTPVWDDTSLNPLGMRMMQELSSIVAAWRAEHAQ